MIKVFLSHQSADSETAKWIAAHLKAYHQIDSYLDVIDPYINKNGNDLASHIQTEMGKCTQLLAVISQSTQHSQWVPWEVGVATEKDFPLATYFGGHAKPPEFLQKWPYLRNENDLDQYALISKSTRNFYVQKRASLGESYARQSSTKNFFTNLRSAIGQY